MSGEDDDIFASLGGSLMKDILSDIHAATDASTGTPGGAPGGGQAGAGSGDTADLDALASLEKELAAFTGEDAAKGRGGGGGGPPGLGGGSPPGLGTASASAAALVVGHAAERSAALAAPAPPPGMAAPAKTGTEGGTAIAGDAWAASIAKFGALGMTDDFLAADSAKKQQGKIGSAPSSSGAPPGIAAAGPFDEYDVDEKVKLAGSSKPPPPGMGDVGAALPPGMGAGGPPGMLSPAALKAEAEAAAAAKGGSPEKAGGAPPPPPGVGAPSPGMAPLPGVLPPGVGAPPGAPQPGVGAPPGAPPPRGALPGAHGAMPPGMARPGMALPPGVPPGAVPPGGMPPPGMGMVLAPGAVPPGVMGVPPGVMLPPGASLPLGMMPPPGAAPPGGMPPPPGAQQGLPPPPAKGEVPEGAKDEAAKAKLKKDEREEVPFKKKDFPALGKETKEGEEADEDDEAGDEPLLAPLPRPSPLPEPEPEQRSSLADLQAVHTRLLFNNPSPRAPPVSATRVRSALMNARDICYVVHSYMRPLHSLDAYNDDYYRWGYDDRKSRNLLVLGGAAGAAASAQGGSTTDLPKPVWKEEKIRAREMEDKYRTTVETRAKDWGERRHVLGRNVKVNVRRPRALLATGGALTSRLREGDRDASADGSSTPDEEASVDSSEHSAAAADPEERARARLWSARLSVDKGYSAYLSLVELRRLLQSNDPAEMRGRKREELSADVEDGIARLHAALGVKVSAPGEGNGGGDGGGGGGGGGGGTTREIEVSRPALSRTLSLPKGRMLLSRVLDEAVLPHPSARRVLPAAVGAVLRTPPSEGKGASGGAPPRGEDRMLRSLAGLVRTERPSVSPRDLLDCLDEVGEAQAELARNAAAGEGEGEGGGDADARGDAIRSMLGGQRARMELLHAVLSRGNELCLGSLQEGEGENAEGYGEEWRRKEGEFMTLLSAAQRRR